jgi:uncharacterized small protein (DUF1192 family)
MDLYELEPAQKKRVLKDLDILSIESLSEYICELKIEITRAQDKISFKEKARVGAETAFKK